jgi:NAD(P)-dependent dehydrogenase (short-subunit alcohol dehydrogenase family)
MSGELQDRVAIVTGASSGIGRATALRLVAAGARVVAFSRSKELLLELESEAAGAILAIAGDVTDESSVERLFAVVEERFGVCDIVVNNAGHVDARLVAEMPLEAWEETFAVNVRGPFLMSRRALPSMIERRQGVIVNVASISAVPGPQKFPGTVAYCASKGAVVSFTEALAAEVKEHGVRVNAVSPGSVETPMLARANPSLVPDMTPEEVAEVIVFLASDRSRPMNGQNVHVFSA